MMFPLPVRPLVFQKGTKYLVRNLDRLTLACRFPDRPVHGLDVPKFQDDPGFTYSEPSYHFLITAGLMGFLGVPIKPSTILVFSVAFRYFGG